MDLSLIWALIVEWTPAVIPVLLSVVGFFALVATKTPNKTDDRVLQAILDVINFLGANLGKAKNKDV